MSAVVPEPSRAQACPHVYRAINRITCAFAKAGIGKTHSNLIDQYQYRSIDDVLNRLSPLLAQHRLCVLPRVLRRKCSDREGELGLLLVNVRLLVAFDLVSARDGSRHTVVAWGEALDASDKGTAKAMSSAFKLAMLEAFCVPVATEDADASSHKLAKPTATPEPPNGWETWAEDIREMIAGCESSDALDRVRTRHAKLLAALKRERPDLYAGIGERFQMRIAATAKPGMGAELKRRSKPTRAQAAKSRKAGLGVTTVKEKVDA